MRQKIRAFFFFINSFQFSNIPLHPFPTLFQRLFPGRIMFSIKAGLRQMLCRLCDTVPFWLGDSKLVVVQNIQSTHSIAGAIPLAFTCLYYTYIYRIRITTKYTTPFTEAFFFLGSADEHFPPAGFADVDEVESKPEFGSMAAGWGSQDLKAQRFWGRGNLPTMFRVERNRRFLLPTTGAGSQFAQQETR